MRINVYSQELTGECVLVSQTARDTGITYHGIRMYLASPDVLHNTPQGDDRSAITFWIPNVGSFDTRDLANLFLVMCNLARNAPPPGHSGEGWIPPQIDTAGVKDAVIIVTESDECKAKYEQCKKTLNNAHSTIADHQRNYRQIKDGNWNLKLAGHPNPEAEKLESESWRAYCDTLDEVIEAARWMGNYHAVMKLADYCDSGDIGKVMRKLLASVGFAR